MDHNFSFAQKNNVCLSMGYDLTFFKKLKKDDFKKQGNINDDDLALLLANCLGHSDSNIRDGIAFEGLVTLLRGARVSDSGKRKLLVECANALKPKMPEGEGFLKPFSALCVAEIARTDRIEPYLVPEERQELVEIGADYLKSITDYRGYDQKDGWRHGVAHTADILMQLTLNDNIGVLHHKSIMEAISTQISPLGEFYVYGEPQRLARPIFFIAMRGTIKEEEWANWLTQIVNPKPVLNDWSEAFSSQEGLAKRHNTNAFLSALYLGVSTSENEAVKNMLPSLKVALSHLP
ncbi:MAG: DUF2785 domain-containing protein [Kordiimonadaceae bacterium]|nr:DUF2785 domain-containing protein [Kordiimonadaceae bacterium]